MFEQAILRNTVVSEYIIGEFCIQFSLHFNFSNGFEAETSNFFL